MSNSDRNRDLDALFRFIERHTFREACSLPWIREWVGDYPAHVITRLADDQAAFSEEERARFIRGLSAQRQEFKLLVLTDGLQQQFEIVRAPRPEVRVFHVDGTDAVVTVHQGSPAEATFYWARARARLQVPKSLVNPRPRGPITSFQPVYVPAGQFA